MGNALLDAWQKCCDNEQLMDVIERILARIEAQHTEASDNYRQHKQPGSYYEGRSDAHDIDMQIIREEVERE